MYVKFQTFDDRNQGDRRTDSDVLVEEILDFYSGRNLPCMQRCFC